MERITPRGFTEHVRTSLFNSGHGFDTERANHAENAYNSYLVSSGRKELKREHLGEALEHFKGNHDFQKLSPHQQEALISSLHKTLGVTEETPAK